MSEKIYGDRDLMAMDIAGNNYCRHVDHMTREKLHSKSDIAAELGWRDMQIVALQQKLDAVLADNVALREYLKECSIVQGEGNWASDTDKSVYVPATEWLPPTPATDAILNEVRAGGVEMYANLLKNRYDGIEYELIGNYETNGEEMRISDIGEVESALSFAAQLRAETDTTSSQYESLAGDK